MGLQALGSSLSNFGDAAASLTRFSWVLWIFVPIAVLILVAVIVKTIVQNKKQWTHKLIIRRVTDNNRCSKPFTIKMRRFPLIRTGEVFELEKPLLGSYLISELDSYTGDNEYSIILDKNNRIYTNKGEFFSPDKSSINVSAKHSEIDIALGDFKQKYQEVHKTKKVTDWKEVAKYAMVGLLIIAVMVVSIKGIEQWGKSHQSDAEKAKYEAEAYANLAEKIKIIDGTVNTKNYILDKIKNLEGTNNVQGIIHEVTNKTS